MTSKILCTLLLALSLAHNAQAESQSLASSGVTDKEIVLGSSSALAGPAQSLGTNLKIGAEVYFDKVNKAGGINGRMIRPIFYDDGYEPKRTIENTKKLIEQDKVFALFGYVGTPTSEVAVPMAARAKIPYLMPFTGAEFLRNPVKPYVFNLRASYFNETAALVDHLVQEQKLKKIAVFIQNDGFGGAGRAGTQIALEKYGLSLAAVGKYERNTVDVDAGLKAVMAAQPEAVIMVGTYKPCAAFLKAAKAKGFSPKFLSISFVGSEALANEAGNAGEGVIISQVVPHPELSDKPIAAAYRNDMAAANKTQMMNYGTIEGYLNAMVITEALKLAGKDITREKFLSVFESLNVDIGGMQVAFSPNSHQGLNQVFLTKIQGGKIVRIAPSAKPL